jgi:NTE family protein
LRFVLFIWGVDLQKEITVSEKKYKTGLVLSGGGTRGFAHLGVLKALEEHDIRPDIISGVSAGSIAGALYADGNDPEEAMKVLANHRLLDYLAFTIPKNSLVGMKGFEKTLRDILRSRTFEELQIPLLVFAVNMNDAKYERFDKGDLIQAVKASSSIPVIFPPVKIDGNQYLDGGVINNFPVEPLMDVCEKIIGVNVNPIGHVNSLGNLKKIAERTFHITLRYQASNKEEKCHIYIEPDELDQFGLLNVSKAKDIFMIGYKKAMEVLSKQDS